MFLFYWRDVGMNSPTTQTCTDKDFITPLKLHTQTCLPIDSISFRHCNHLQFPLDISALVWEVHSQVYSPSFLSGEQINFPLFTESRGLVQVQLCPNSHWTQKDLVEKFGHVHCQAFGIFELPSYKPSGAHVQLHLQLLYPCHNQRAPNFCGVPVSFQVTWGFSRANWDSRGTGQKLQLWPPLNWEGL